LKVVVLKYYMSISIPLIKFSQKGGLLYMPQLAPLPINELEKGALEMVELRFMYVPGAGHAGIHRNPESSNHLVPSH